MLWFTRLSWSGKTTVAGRWRRRYINSASVLYPLDGDNVRHGLCSDLVLAMPIKENIRRVVKWRIGWLKPGLVVLTAFNPRHTAPNARWFANA
ncbi:adenylyl-sulfate kinase [Shigella flexneri]